MNYILAWQINTQGNSEGLPIPSGFAIALIISPIKANNSGEGNFAILEVQVCTFKTPAFVDTISYNTDLEALGYESGGNTKKFDITSDDLNSSVRTLCRNQILSDLQTAYGSGNVVEL